MKCLLVSISTGSKNQDKIVIISVTPARHRDRSGEAGGSVGSSDPEKHRRGAGEKKLVGYAKAICSYHDPIKEKT